MSTQTRKPVVHVQHSSIALERDDGDANHIPVGDMRAYWSAAFTSSDGMLEVGYWEFAGGMMTLPFDGRELVMIVLTGAGEIECEGTTTAFSQGDVVVHDSPVPEKTMTSDDGFSAVYVTRFRTREDLARARPGAVTGSQ